jgi:hypothetical protein
MLTEMRLTVSLSLPAGLVAVAVVWLACTIPDLNAIGKTCTDSCPDGLACINHVCGGSLDDGPSSDGDGGFFPDAFDGDARCNAVPDDTCVTLPMFHGSQTVDGRNDDFCGVPAFVFDPLNEQLTQGPRENPGLSFQATVQAAWSAGPNPAFHVFVHVPRWPPQPHPSSLYNGDAVEILVAASQADLTGDVEGDPGTMHLIVAPAFGTDASGYEAGAFIESAQANGGPLLMNYPPYAARVEPGVGYDVELEIPLSVLGQPDAAWGPKVGFDVGIDLVLPNDDGGFDWYQTFHEVLGLSGGAMPNGACPFNNFPTPSCDDRTWCTPTLGDF